MINQPSPKPPDDEQWGLASPAGRSRAPLLPLSYLVVAVVAVLILDHTGGGVPHLVALLCAVKLRSGTDQNAQASTSASETVTQQPAEESSGRESTDACPPLDWEPRPGAMSEGLERRPPT
jgi:hypothetical protein